jgi:excisionase family DNA binding protein
MNIFVQSDHLRGRCRTLSVQETAKILGFSPQTVYNAIHAGTVRAIRISEKRVRISQTEVQRILEGGLR